MTKKHHKNKTKGCKIARSNSKGMSAIQDFVRRLKLLESKARIFGDSEIVVGWADESKEQKRTMSKGAALAINERRKAKGKKGNGELVSNFDENFVGPGIQAASLATIAKVNCYGRSGGVNSRTGKPYGAIPARNFVDVLKKKHMKPIAKTVKDAVYKTIAPKNAPDTAAFSLHKLGVVCKGQLQRAMMDSNEYVANAPITISGGWMANPKNGKPFHVEPKKSARPLWNQGTLIKSVDFEIRGKK